MGLANCFENLSDLSLDYFAKIYFETVRINSVKCQMVAAAKLN